jgi:hypothetical protein
LGKIPLPGGKAGNRKPEPEGPGQVRQAKLPLGIDRSAANELAGLLEEGHGLLGTGSTSRGFRRELKLPAPAPYLKRNDV